MGGMKGYFGVQCIYLWGGVWRVTPHDLERKYRMMIVGREVQRAATGLLKVYGERAYLSRTVKKSAAAGYMNTEIGLCGTLRYAYPQT